MKCPHCAKKVGFFSKEMNALGRTKVCPHCSKGVKLGVQHGKFALVFFPVAIIATLVTGNTPLACGLAGGTAAVFGMGLKAS